jgi:hypothetical protein
VARLDLLLWCLILGLRLDALLAPNRLDCRTALTPFDVGRVSLEEAHVDAVRSFRQDLPTFGRDSIDPSAYLFQQTSSLQEHVRPGGSVREGRLTTAWQHFGKIRFGQSEILSELAPQIGGRYVAVCYRAKHWEHQALKIGNRHIVLVHRGHEVLV